MPIPINLELYNIVKKEADKIYSKPSAYKSGYIVKEYKKRGGTYQNDRRPRNLKRWFKEEWGDIGGKDYPVYRPFKRISKDTPLTAYEIDPVQAEKQIALKQRIRGSRNLPKFLGQGFFNIPFLNELQRLFPMFFHQPETINLFGEGRNPDEFKKSIQNVFDILAIRGKFNIIGSASDENILYYSDFDLSTFEKVSLESIIKIFQDKFKVAEKDPSIFITDFKCGEYRDEPVRWNKTNIKTGSQIVDGKKITLEECLLMPSTIKMDIVALIDGDFVEFSDNYYLSVNGVKNYSDDEVSKKVLIRELEKSAREYYDEPNYFKYLKRIFSIKTIKGNSTKKLIDFFNSQVGLLNKSKTDLETLILVLENNFRKPKLEDVCNNIQIIKQNISGVSEVELKSTLYKDLDKICSYKNQTSIIKNLKKVISYILKKVNETTLHFIKKNKI
jgi:hypothetical protein